MTAGLVTTGIGLGLGSVAYRFDGRATATARAIAALEAVGAPPGQIDPLEQDLRRQRITVVTAAVGAGAFGVAGLTLLAVALFRRDSPSLTRRTPRVRPGPGFVFAF